MPKIRSYTPAWLTAPAPGHTLFVETERASRSSTYSPYGAAKAAEPGPKRTIARRGTEVFIANGREIKWGDLVHLKETYEPKSGRTSAGIRIKREDSDSFPPEDANGDSRFAQGFRSIKTPVADEIKQLIISPHSDLLAVVTTHTVHVCLLPDPSHLTAEDTGIIKPKYFTLGPTTHVTSKSPVAAALWHPLGVKGSALVTVTQDAVVRMWEISPTDRWSFDSPSLAIDLRKLADGTSLDQDFSASTSTTNKTFSPDSFDMEVAAACFGGRRSGGWSTMTLWIAMRGGDVYALCPLLPQKWAPPPMLIESLSVSIVAKVAALEDDPEVSAQAKLLAQQQLEWMADLDNQEPRVMEAAPGDPELLVYTRPTHPGVVPRLQGPFDLDLDPETGRDEDDELTDIFAIGEKLDVGDLMEGEDEDLELGDIDHEGLPLSVLCLLSPSGRVRICIDFDGVEAKWLPPRNKSRSSRLLEEIDVPTLLTFQTLDMLRPSEEEDCIDISWPVFTPDVTSRYSFYVTHPFGMTYVSLSPWVFRLAGELGAGPEDGQDFRIGLMVKGENSTRERIYTHPQPATFAACTAIRDPDLGYFILSATPQGAVAVNFDTPEDDFEAPVMAVASPTPEVQSKEQLEVLCAPRPPFQPPEEFDQRSDLPKLFEMMKTSKYRSLMQQEVRLSGATLNMFTNVHHAVGGESGRLNKAAAQLFTRLDNLPAELAEQVRKAEGVKQKVDGITGVDANPKSPTPDSERLLRRLEAAKARQEELAQRMEKLKRTINRATPRELSDKERAWMDEVASVQSSISPGEAGLRPARVKQHWKRLEEVKALKEDLLKQAEKLQQKPPGEAREEPLSRSLSNRKIPPEIRKVKVAQVQSLLERETALVEAVKNRLERLSVG
ncbi:uncharacterized protein E0L32_007210 [Thyridium curvatum]|uniref:Uncharacterized protein n=1 Tax=Thyridium curvatum TaxID=1093900 RepID=A0A507AMY1_9PEZI|nr:uncharacterized protein E0L32_007210 [Thyridium curvatum]TPX12095.1 hypothetical protein E0L32_007210 [Thyridium curvatum]